MTTSTYTKVEIDEKTNQLYKLIMNVMDHVYECDKKVDEKIKKCNQQVYRMNEIAEVINEGIYMLNERLDGMTEKTDKINKKLDETIPYKISEINAKMLEIDQKFDYMDEKIAERLDEHIEDTDDKITEKLNEIYDKCNHKLDELNRSINTHEELIHKITGLETELDEIKHKMVTNEELEETFNTLTKYYSALHQTLAVDGHLHIYDTVTPTNTYIDSSMKIQEYPPLKLSHIQGGMTNIWRSVHLIKYNKQYYKCSYACREHPFNNHVYNIESTNPRAVNPRDRLTKFYNDQPIGLFDGKKIKFIV